jgi:NADPH:quinone reductase-like Zn-dependent oxidoreductase
MKIRKVRIYRFGGPEVLSVNEVEQSMPDALQLLVSVKAASINRVDFKIRNGQYPAVKGLIEVCAIGERRIKWIKQAPA